MRRLIKAFADIDRPSNFPIARVKQEDDVTIEIELYKSGLAYNPTGQTISIWGQRKDGAIIQQTTNITVSANKITVVLKNSFFLVKGHLHLELQLLDSSGKTTIAMVCLSILEKVGGEDSVISTSEVTALEEVLRIANSTKDKLQIVFDASENEATREANEKRRLEVETFRDGKEADRDKRDKERATFELARQTAETDRVKVETNRVNAEGSRVTAENNRVTAETSRVTAEASRVTAENTRKTSETLRANAEITRVNAETGRGGAETSRVNAEKLRKDAEDVRVHNETARVAKEQERQYAELDRIDEERNRFFDENARRDRENGRIEAELNRGKAMDSMRAEYNALKLALEDMVEQNVISNAEIDKIISDSINA